MQQQQQQRPRREATGLADGPDEHRRRHVTFAPSSEPDARSTAVDTALFAAMGLSAILRPAKGPVHWPRTAVRALCWLVVGLQAAQAVRLFRSLDRGPQLVYETAIVVNGLLSVYMGLVLTGRVDGVREALRAADHGFTRSSRRRPAELRRSGAALSTWLRVLVPLAFGTVGLWVTIEWFAVPAGPSDVTRFVRAAWSTSQTVSLPAFVYIGLTFDICLVTTCFALDAQFRIVSASCETVGHNRPPVSAAPAAVTSTAENNDENSCNTRFEVEDNYDELMHHICDMQKLTNKLDDFYAIVRPVTIVQVIISCLSIMTFSFFTIEMCFMGWSNAPTTVIKFFFGFLTIAFELFLYCYAFNQVDTARSTLNFGLYSSNWTEMDLKFQKTMLLTMRMNSAHKQDMRITPKLKVDLELFGKTIGLSYRIVSVLVNK